eukprot:2055420-Amphidinium_carterae.1
MGKIEPTAAMAAAPLTLIVLAVLASWMGLSQESLHQADPQLTLHSTVHTPEAPKTPLDSQCHAAPVQLTSSQEPTNSDQMSAQQLPNPSNTLCCAPRPPPDRSRAASTKVTDSSSYTSWLHVVQHASIPTSSACCSPCASHPLPPTMRCPTAITKVSAATTTK